MIQMRRSTKLNIPLITTIKSVLNTSVETEAKNRKLQQAYEYNHQIRQKIKYIKEQNNRSRIKILNLEKQKNSITENFHQICKILQKQKSESYKKLDPPAIQKTKIKFKYLKNKVNQYSQELNKLIKDQKSIKISELKNKCQQYELENIKLISEIRMQLAKKKEKISKKVQQSDSELNVIFQDQNIVQTEIVKHELLKHIENLEKQKEEIIKKIQQQNKQISNLQKKKNQLLVNYTICNDLIQKKESCIQINTNMNKEIQQLIEKLDHIEITYHKQNQANQELTQKLLDRKDLQAKQTKNLKEQIQKCSEQCKQIKNKFFVLQEKKRNNEKVI